MNESALNGPEANAAPGSDVNKAGAPRGLVEFTALPVLLAWATLDRVESEGPGAKLSRGEVTGIVQGMHEAIDRGEPAVAGD